MSKPTREDLIKLSRNRYDFSNMHGMDAEGFHDDFDQILEAKLDELDPEFMKSMREVYDASRCDRWYA